MRRGSRWRRLRLGDAWLCAAVACLNAVCWSIVMPPFQVNDEPDHFAYVQQLAVTGRLPVSGAPPHSAPEERVLDDLHFADVHFRSGETTIASVAEQRRLERDLAKVSRAGLGQRVSAGLAGTEPPLFYALETIPYRLGSSGTMLERLQLMRLLAALMAGFTACFAFLFLREVIPAVPWTWTVGGLGVALFPLLAEISGGVNPEGMLYAVSAGLFYCLARAFRRGFTVQSAAMIGSALVVGLLSKLNFIGLLPGTAVGLMILSFRELRVSRRKGLQALLCASGVLFAAGCAYVLVNLLERAPLLGATLSDAAHQTGKRGSLLGELSFIWQMYLPRLPGMKTDFAGLLTTRDIWFNGLVGYYGWFETYFPDWVYTAALLPFGLIGLLCMRTLVTLRGSFARRGVELTVYVLMALGLMGLVGADGYLGFPAQIGIYAEARYLLPLIVFWGAALALAARGVGRRWGPVVGVILVMLALAHDIFSQLLVVSRYYG